MKYLIYLFALLLTITPFVSAQTSGTTAVLFDFQGFANLGVNNVHGGAGVRTFINENVSVRGTLGTTITTGENKRRDVNLSAAYLLGTGVSAKNTEFYFGPQVVFIHSEPNNNAYELSGVIGVGFFPWEGISFGAEYEVAMLRNAQRDVTVWSFGKTTGSIILSVWL